MGILLRGLERPVQDDIVGSSLKLKLKLSINMHESTMTISGLINHQPQILLM